MSGVIVKQKENVPEVPTEVIAQSIVEIAEGIRKIRQTRLNDKALFLLINKASGVGIKEIETVLTTIGNLEYLYLKKK